MPEPTPLLTYTNPLFEDAPLDDASTMVAPADVQGMKQEAECQTVKSGRE